MSEQVNATTPWPDPDTAPVYEFVDSYTGEVTKGLTIKEVLKLQDKWRADYEARVQAKIEADAASFVPEPYEEDE